MLHCGISVVLTPGLGLLGVDIVAKVQPDLVGPLPIVIVAAARPSPIGPPAPWLGGRSPRLRRAPGEPHSTPWSPSVAEGWTCATHTDQISVLRISAYEIQQQ